MTVKTIRAAVAVVALLAGFGRAFGAEPEAAEHRDLILEVAPAGEWGLGDDGKRSFGPSFALAVTPIEHQLEVEFGLTPMFDHGKADWEGEIVFKKPFELSKNLELLVGIGPQWATPSNSFGAVAKLDLVYWKTPKIGLFVEPSYSYAFNGGHEQSLTLKAGILFALSSR
jgi:hypothetical protein